MCSEYIVKYLFSMYTLFTNKTMKIFQKLLQKLFTFWCSFDRIIIVRKVIHLQMSTKESKEMREQLYVIGRRNFEKQQVGLEMPARPYDTTSREYDDMGSPWWKILFGVDSKGRMYMALATKEIGATDYIPAHKSCGHWHSGGCRIYTKGYKVFARKNFDSKEEANKYYNVMKYHFEMRTGKDEDTKSYSEAELFSMFN